MIIKYKMDMIEVPGGNMPPALLKPSNLNAIDQLKVQLEAIPLFLGDEYFELTHVKKEDGDEIPPSSRRCLNAFKFLFSSNKISHETTIFDEDERVLKFIYSLNYQHILSARDKLSELYEFMDRHWESKNAFLDFAFDENNKEEFNQYILNFKNEKQLSIWARTNILKFISDISAYLFDFKLFNLSTNITNQGSITFASKSAKDKAKIKMESEHVDVLYEDDLTIDYSAASPISVKGAISFIDNSISRIIPIRDEEEGDILEAAVLSQLKDGIEYNSVKIGVIDGGVPENSFVKDEIDTYSSNTTFGWGDNPEGNHAEEVCSILLFANKLSSKTRDHLTTPRVHLFDVIGDSDSLSDIKKKIKHIISLYSATIKIWNFSIVFNSLKDSDMISPLGVFFDQLQKEHEVIFILPTGNKFDESDKYVMPAPVGSVYAYAVGGCKRDGSLVDYHRQGIYGYLPTKPDAVIESGDDESPIILCRNNLKSASMGTSFAAPLVSRKCAHLNSLGFSIVEIPAILNAYAKYYADYHNISLTQHHGHGVLPVDTRGLLELKDKNLIFVANQQIAPRYTQGFLDLTIPKTIEGNKYDFSYYISTNTNAITERNDTYEYILDSIRVTFGKVMTETKIQPWTPDDRGYEFTSEDAIESELRKTRGKYKNRDTFKKTLRNSIKDTFKHKGEDYLLEKWGIKLTRNAVSGRRDGHLDFAICIILSSKTNNQFYQSFLSLNNENIIQQGISVPAGIIEKNDGVEFI